MDDATIACVIGFDSWPPGEAFSLISQRIERTTYEIQVNPTGYFSVITKDDEARRVYHFARIVFNGTAKHLILMLTAGSDQPTLRINQKLLPSCVNPASARVVLVNTGSSEEGVRAQNAIAIDGVPANGASEAESFFVNALQELNAASQSASSYTVLRASGLLRLLLLDGLLGKANMRLRQKIVFKTNNCLEALPPGLPEPEVHWRSLSPDFGATPKLLDLGLEAFLKAPVVALQGNTASVRDVIQACANVKGGVHFGSLRDDPKQAVVIEIDKRQVIFGSASSVQSLRGICYIVVKALSPLVRAIQTT